MADGDGECAPGARPAPHETRGRHHGALEGARAARREPGPAAQRPCASSATTCRTRAARTRSPPWWFSRTVCRARTRTAPTISAVEDGSGTPDDTSAMNEVLTRRFSRLLAEEAGVEGRGRGWRRLRLWSDRRDDRASQAFLVQARPGTSSTAASRRSNAARAALDAVGADVPVVGLAKRLEEVWIPGDEFPLILPRTSEALYLLQYLRDESHRFAITKHRKRRSKAQRRSVLDSIPGLGPARQAALLKHFGSVKRIREASPSSRLPRSRAWDPPSRRTIRDRLASIVKGGHTMTIDASRCRCRRACCCLGSGELGKEVSDRPAALRLHRHRAPTPTRVLRRCRSPTASLRVST